MKFTFGVEDILPDTQALRKLTTHCWDILYPIIRESAQCRKLNYLADGMEAEILHSDGKWYRIEIKPMKEGTPHVQ
jgi:hypothetical protein